MMLPDFCNDFLRRLPVLLCVDFCRERSGVPKNDSSQFDAVLLPQRRRRVVSQLVGMPLMLSAPLLSSAPLLRCQSRLPLAPRLAGLLGESIGQRKRPLAGVGDCPSVRSNVVLFAGQFLGFPLS